MKAACATSRFVRPEAASTAIAPLCVGQLVRIAAPQPDPAELVARSLRPVRGAEPFEDLQRLAERVGGSKLLLQPPLERALHEQVPCMVERQLVGHGRLLEERKRAGRIALSGKRRAPAPAAGPAASRYAGRSCAALLETGEEPARPLQIAETDDGFE